MFRNAVSDAPANPWSCFGELVATIALGKSDQRLQITNASIGESSGVSAGYLVPPEFVASILDGALQKEVVRPNALLLPMSSAEIDIADFDYQDHTSGKRAGLQLLWTSESGALTEQVAVARKITMKACKAAILCRISSELVEDVVSFDKMLSTAMTAAVAAGLDAVFLNGTGAGQPAGIIGSPAAIVIAKESSPAQPTGTVWLQNLAKMLGRLSPTSFGSAVWLVHPTTLPMLYTMVVVIQNVAATENVGGSFTGAVTQSADGTLRIFGRPVIVTEAVSTLSSAGDVVLADLSRYLVCMRREAFIELNRAVYFNTDEIGIKMTLRLNGQPLASTPTKLRDGSSTVSPYVVLGAR